MLETGLFALLAEKEPLQALLGTAPFRLFPVLVPEDAVYPCATFQVVSKVPQYVLSGKNTIERARIQFDAWSGGSSTASYLAARNVAIAIRKTLEGFTGQLPLPSRTHVAWIEVVAERDLYEQDARSYRTSIDFMIHVYA